MTEQIKIVGARRRASAESKDEAPLLDDAQLVRLRQSGVAEKATDLAALNRQIKDLETRKKLLVFDIVSQVDPERIAFCRARNAYHGSVKLNGLTYISYHNQAKNYDDGEVAECKLAFGPLYDTYFRDIYSIATPPDVLSPELVAAITAAGGVVEFVTKAQKQLEADRALVPAVFEACKAARIFPVAYLK
jgi:hypothetical protein